METSFIKKTLYEILEKADCFMSDVKKSTNQFNALRSELVVAQKTAVTEITTSTLKVLGIFITSILLFYIFRLACNSPTE